MYIYRNFDDTLKRYYGFKCGLCRQWHRRKAFAKACCSGFNIQAELARVKIIKDQIKAEKKRQQELEKQRKNEKPPIAI